MNPSMTALPTGTVTFFFSDIEGSTRLLEGLGPDYDDLLDRHNRILRDVFARCAAVEIGTEGDSFLAVFPRPADAVEAAVAAQRAIAREQWPQASAPRIRIGLHTGEARIAGGTYVGLDLHRAARIMAAAHGGQILLSEPTRALVERSLGDGIEFRDLGEHRLRDLSGRERLFQVVAAGLVTDFPPPRTLEVTPTNLPTQPTELVGRERELREIRERLESSSSRLLTLTGPGGIGKTRLALQAAADESHRFVDGAYFVDLAGVRDPAGVLQAIVEGLGLPVAGRADLQEALAQELARRHLLLLLDNFEQVIEAADDVAALLRRSPRLTVLATSREALRVRGEQVFPVSPLERSAAVRLFLERAQQARPDFVLTDENAEAVAEIGAGLDGLPLAIELAAARIRLFSPADLRDRLRDRLDLLRGGPRDLPERHRTMRSAIEWSYELLDDEERWTLELVSLFPSARVDAVEEVAAGVARLAHADVLDRLASLVDKSLLRSVEDERGQRLSMLDTIREYAGERLEDDAELALSARRAHAEYYAGLAEAARRELGGGGREAALDRLATELGNLQLAWAYFADRADLARLGTLLDALWPLHDARGWYHGAVGLTNELLEVLWRTSPAPERAEEEITLRLSVARGVLALRGYTEEVEELYRSALALSEASGAVPRRLPVLKSLASFHLYRGEIDKTIAVGREVLELAEREGDMSLQVEGDLILGPALAFVGEAEAGLEHLDRAIALFDPERDGRAPFRLGPNPGVAARAISALLRWLFGFPDTSARHAASALELGERLRHPYSLAYATFHMALLELWNGRLESTSERAGEVLDIAEEHDYRIWRALGLVLQGAATAGLGRHGEGLALAEEGASLYENLRTPPIFWSQVLALRAEAFALAGRSADALALLDQAAGLSAEGSWESARLKVQRAELLAALGDAPAAESWLLRGFEEAAGAGTRMTQLRAATSLARLTGSSEAAARLQDVLETFTEGFDTPPLLEARAALDAADSRGA